jgi:hypothetical protein
LGQPIQRHLEQVCDPFLSPERTEDVIRAVQALESEMSALIEFRPDGFDRMHKLLVTTPLQASHRDQTDTPRSQLTQLSRQ